jgi:hypothetical protein
MLRQPLTDTALPDRQTKNKKTNKSSYEKIIALSPCLVVLLFAGGPDKHYANTAMAARFSFYPG